MELDFNHNGENQILKKINVIKSWHVAYVALFLQL
jgi:hypothetical protein